MRDLYTGHDADDPSDPSWAGAFSGGHWMFTRDGRWHIHDAETGELLGILPLIDPGVMA